MVQKSAKKRSGFVAVVGKPNVGKSTLINRLVGEKVSIVSSTPKTTRDRVSAILTKENIQIIFIDTPGIHQSKYLLDKYMIRESESSLDGADIVIVMIDASCGIENEDERVIDIVEKFHAYKILALNKVDRIIKQDLLPLLDQISKRYNFDDYIPISATKGSNTERLLNIIIQNIPESEFYYPEDQLSDKSMRFHVAEIVREKILVSTYQEIPFSVAVLVEEFKESRPRKKCLIKASIYVERDSQKAIIIGKGASMLKKIGTEARIEIENFLKRKVFLDLQVRVSDKWRKDSLFLRRLGYGGR
ncbi:MAG TPA: GTPase Era [Candidatus Omnitrophica bacterium]|nr:GTPase Era [Candidatus Omnitrophota bacterium]